MSKNNIPVQRIREFVDKYLDGNLDNFENFRLTLLNKDKIFGCPGRSFDCDDTELMRCIYVVLFSDVFPNLSLETLELSYFRGDTLNTYNTLFGRPNENSKHPGLDRFVVSNELRLKVEAFQMNYSLIGNMIVLPNIKVKGKSINTYRGCHFQWHDYFDQFALALRDVLLGNVDVDNKLVELVSANASSFALFRGISGFKRFVDGLLLADYVDVNCSPVVSSKGYYFWKKDLYAKEYEAEANRYIDFSNKVINNRTKIMIQRLKELL